MRCSGSHGKARESERWREEQERGARLGERKAGGGRGRVRLVIELAGLDFLGSLLLWRMNENYCAGVHVEAHGVFPLDFWLQFSF